MKLALKDEKEITVPSAGCVLEELKVPLCLINGHLTHRKGL